NRIASPFGEHLGKPLKFAVAQRTIVVLEGCGEQVVRDASLANVRLREADTGHLRLGECRPRDSVEVARPGAREERVPDHYARLIVCPVGELVRTCDIADGPDRGYRRTASRVDAHRLIIDRDADVVETEIFHVRVTAGGDEDLLDIDGPLSFGHSYGHPFQSVASVGSDHPRTIEHGDALLAEPARQYACDVFVLTRQDVIAGGSDRHLRAETAECLAKLRPDRTTADHEYRCGGPIPLAHRPVA